MRWLSRFKVLRLCHFAPYFPPEGGATNEPPIPKLPFVSLRLSDMLLQEPPESAYDLRFELFGFPIRIAWTFWLGALVIGYGLVNGIDQVFGGDSPGRLALLLLWALCLLVSIVIHELGHAFAFRQCGVESSIVLYHFGGLATPRSSFRAGGGFGNLNVKQDLWIAAAGPLAQLASALVLVGVIKSVGYRVTAFAWMPGGLHRIPGVLEGQEIANAALFALVTFYVLPSVVWALLNLIPVWPLDGGRIMRALILIGGGRTDTSLWISLIAAGAMAAYGFSRGSLFMGILFLSLAVSNYQLLQGQGGWRF